MAEQKLQRVVDIFGQCYPPDHIAVAFARTNLAQLYIDQRKSEEARPLMDRALPIIRVTYPGMRANLAAAVYEEARMEAGLRDFANADVHFRESISGYEKSVDPHDPGSAPCYGRTLRSSRRLIETPRRSRWRLARSLSSLSNNTDSRGSQTSASEDLKVDLEFVLHLDHSATDADGLDSKIRLFENRVGGPGIAGLFHRQTDPLRDAVQRQVTIDFPLPVGESFDPRGAECDLGIFLRLKRHLFHMHLDRCLIFRVDLGVGLHRHFRGFNSELDMRGRRLPDSAGGYRRVDRVVVRGSQTTVRISQRES